MRVAIHNAVDCLKYSVKKLQETYCRFNRVTVSFDFQTVSLNWGKKEKL